MILNELIHNCFWYNNNLEMNIAIDNLIFKKKKKKKRFLFVENFETLISVCFLICRISESAMEGGANKGISLFFFPKKGDCKNGGTFLCQIKDSAKIFKAN